DGLSLRPKASHSAIQSGTRCRIFLHVAECLFSRLSSRRLQDILLDLLQRRLVAHLPNRTQVDVPWSNPAIVISARLSVCAAGRFQAFICTRCCWMHAGDVPALSAHLRNVPPDCRSAAYVWV